MENISVSTINFASVKEGPRILNLHGRGYNLDLNKKNYTFAKATFRKEECVKIERYYGASVLMS